MRLGFFWLSITCALALLNENVPVRAQNAFHPNPLDSLHSNLFADSLFSDRAAGFVLGHQWGPASLDKLNSALNMNVTCDNYGYMHELTVVNDVETSRRIKLDSVGRLGGVLGNLYKLGNGTSDTNYLVWSAPLIDVKNMSDFNGRWIGMRWDPAEASDLSSSWQPRDEDAWPFGFAARYHGDAPNTGDNYRRYVLSVEQGTTYPAKALDSAEPRNSLFIRDNEVNWNMPWSDTSHFSDTINARRLQLVINLRRTDSADLVSDDSVVVSVVVPYFMRWKQQADTALLHDSSRHRMPFRLIPADHKDSAFALPMSRGLEMPMRSPLYVVKVFRTNGC